MKKILSLAFSILIASSLSSQTIIENPPHGVITMSGLRIDKVELGDEFTILHFTSFAENDKTFTVPENLSIMSLYDWKVDSVIRAEGIELGEPFFVPKSGEVKWKAFFPALSDSTRVFDVGTFWGSGSWLIYEIQIEEPLFPFYIPKEIQGHWVNNTNGDWEIGVLDTMVFHEQQVWTITDFHKEEGQVILHVKKNQHKASFKFKYDKKGNYFFGINNDKLKRINKIPENQYASYTSKDESFNTPLFKFDSVTISGYMTNWNPRLGINTLNIRSTNIFNRGMDTEIADITDNGYFSITIPCYHPTEVHLSTMVLRRKVFVEPGDSIFVLIDINKPDASLYMGESARINKELMLINNSIEQIPFPSDQVSNMTPEEYKSAITQHMNASIKKLEILKSENNISNKANKIASNNIRGDAYGQMGNYEGAYLSAYIRKNNLTSPFNRSDLPEVNIPDGYYNFISNIDLNDPSNLISGNFNRLISLIKYKTGFLREIYQENSYGLSEFARDLEAEGMIFSADESNYIKAYEEAYTKEFIAYQREYFEKYGQKSRELEKRYEDNFEEAKTLYDVSYLTIDQKRQYLTDQGLITKEDLEILDQTEAYEKHPAKAEIQEVSKKYSQAQKKIMVDLSDKRSELAQNYYNELVLQEMKKRYNMQEGIFTDILKVQDIMQNLDRNYSPLSEEQLNQAETSLGSDFTKQYLRQANQELIETIERNRTLVVSNKNETPSSSPEALFASIVGKYEGKVIYVDFWASWCAPCRSGMKTIAPLKAELAEKDIVFLYITGPSTPQETWENLTPNISGEHYRVDDKEWNELQSMFKIHGIPHYMLISKDGAIVQPHLPHMSNSQLKQTLLQELDK